MRRRTAIRSSFAAALAGGALCASTLAWGAEERSGAALYAEHCASCHGKDRLGQQGPALIPESLARLRRPQATAVITKGRGSTQMPAFGDALSADEITRLVAYVYSPLAEKPRWTKADIEASRVVRAEAPALERPVFKADPLNLFVVVEAGDHHVTILDGDRFEPIHRFKSHFALHGGPKFTPDGRFVYFMSRDGWVTKFDLWSLKVLAETRAGLNSRNIAMSQDGRYLAVANYLPNTLVILDAKDLRVARILDVKDRHGQASRVSAVYQAPQRKSFVAALKDVPEIWEIATDPNAPPIYTGLVHSYEKGMVEALPTDKGLFGLRRIEIGAPLDDFFFDPSYRNLLGSSRDGQSAMVVNLTVGREIKRLDLPGLPHLGSGISWVMKGADGTPRRVIAVPHLKDARISIIDAATWTIVKQIETDGPGFFLRSHEKSRYVFGDSMLSRNKDRIHVIDKETLAIVKTLRPMPGKTAAHVEFDRSGRHALVSIWENDGALIVYDARTLEEVKRIAMSKPSGKYNVFNKITFSEGTSH